MKQLLSDSFLIQFLQNSSVATFNYMSFTLAVVVLVIACYCLAKKKKYGMYLLASSLLLLINPALSMIF